MSIFADEIELQKSGNETVHDASRLVIGSGLDLQEQDEDGAFLVEATASSDSDTTDSTSDSDGGGGGMDISVSQSRISLADGETLVLHRFTAPTDTTLEVNSAGVSDSSGSVPSGLEIEVYNNTDGATEHSTTATFENGSPLTSTNIGGDDVEIRLVNGTGGTVDVTGFLNAVMA